MSVTKNKQTDYYSTAQDVVFKLQRVELSNLQALSELCISGRFIGQVGTSEGAVDKKSSTLFIQDIRNDFSLQEKQAARIFIAALERELAKKVPDLVDAPHDNTDVFVDNP